MKLEPQPQSHLEPQPHLEGEPQPQLDGQPLSATASSCAEPESHIQSRLEPQPQLEGEPLTATVPSCAVPLTATVPSCADGANELAIPRLLRRWDAVMAVGGRAACRGETR